MKLFILLCFPLLVSLNAFAKTAPSVDEAISKSIQYVAQKQFQEKMDLYNKGEWPVQMKSYFLPAILGVGKLFARPTEEPTAFGTSTIINLLSEIYFVRPELSQIPKMVNDGIASLTGYENSGIYSYYPFKQYRGTTVRGPLAEGYVPNFIAGLTNIPSDADTTSATYMALAYANSINTGKKLSDFAVPKETLETFNSFRDVNRTAHYYNWLDGIKQTGAFLTWFQNEKDPAMPKGLFSKPDKGTRIPFGKNDVDCVVNANVMRLLQSTQNTAQPGFNDSCQFLNSVILQQKQRMCGIYYPNSYAVFFTISNVYKAGAQCLEKSRAPAIQFIISTQKDDGSWDNEPGIGRLDNVQSTALALNALLNYVDQGNPQYRSAVQAAVFYLLNRAKREGDDKIFWDGEVFFSAVAQARNTVLWRSDSYTTALAALALVKAQTFLSAPR